MTAAATPQISIIVATRDRAASLARLLPTLEAARQQAAVSSEVLVVDNGSRDGTAALLADWQGTDASRRILPFAPPGKCRALNAAILATAAPLIVFTDDDVILPPDWLQALTAFCAAHPEYDAAMGKVLIDPAADAALRERIAFYRAVPHFDKGDESGDTHHLWGCNMAIRRHVFERVGGFDERLGPGTGLANDDTELGVRIRAAGMRIAYVPAAVVYHEVDPSRLSPEYFREQQLRTARGQFAMNLHRSLPRSYLHFGGALLTLALWSAAANPARRHRAWGRTLMYRELLRLQHAARRKVSTTA
ncbi:MAG: glycosyltransferase [bacterium]